MKINSTKRNNSLNKRLRIYADIAKDLVSSSISAFLPYDKDKNPDGDKTLVAGDIFWDFALAKESMNEDKNLLKKYHKNMVVASQDPEYNINPERVKAVGNKKNALDNLLGMKRYKDSVYEESSVTGKFINSLAGEIPIEDSRLISDELFTGYLKAVSRKMKEGKSNLGVQFPNNRKPTDVMIMSKEQATDIVDGVYRSLEGYEKMFLAVHEVDISGDKRKNNIQHNKIKRHKSTSEIEYLDNIAENKTLSDYLNINASKSAQEISYMGEKSEKKSRNINDSIHTSRSADEVLEDTKNKKPNFLSRFKRSQTDIDMGR
jgi:hypothetical protein